MSDARKQIYEYAFVTAGTREIVTGTVLATSKGEVYVVVGSRHGASYDDSGVVVRPFDPSGNPW